MAGLLSLMAILLVALAATWRAPIAVVTPPSPASLAREQVARGAALVRIGDCAVCHSASGGRPYAGGVGVNTPFGVVYATNITPDVKTGIGGWSEAAFDRAMRDGVARDGSHLYPALPYTHYTHVSDADLSDIYAFLMTRTPVQARPPSNRLIPPLGFRPLLAGWKLLFLKTGAIAADPAKSAQWNRGRYLAEGLAHCSACHTPRDLLGGEVLQRPYAGGWSDGWYAPPLNAGSPAARAWTVDDIYAYLRTGLSPDHAAAAGPMGAVSRQLSAAPEADVQAISLYFASLLAGAPAARAPRSAIDRVALAAVRHPQGAALFAGACESCHGAGAPMMLQGRPALPLGSPLHEASARDTVQIILKGLQPPVGRSGPYMPPYAASFTDAQVAEIAGYLRARYSDEPPWSGDLTRQVAKARKEGAS